MSEPNVPVCVCFKNSSSCGAVIRIASDAYISELVQKIVRELKGKPHIDCTTVEAYSGNKSVSKFMKVAELLCNGCGSETNPLLIEMRKCMHDWCMNVVGIGLDSVYYNSNFISYSKCQETKKKYI